MKERWRPVAVLVGVLFGINVVARLVSLATSADSDDAQTRIGLTAVSIVALVMIVAGYRWAVRYPPARAAGDLGLAVVAACLLSLLVGPLVSGSYPFAEGAGLFFDQLWQYLALAGGGAVFGVLVAITLGRDYKSQAWKRFEQTTKAKPRRVVRR